MPQVNRSLGHGALVIAPPPPPERISTSAVDLTLGGEFVRWQASQEQEPALIVDPSQADFFPELVRRLHA